MKKSLLTFTITLLLAFPFLAKAQPQELSETDIANFKIRVKEKVEAFQNHISIVADKEEAMAKKNLAINAALKLFLATATMEVSSFSAGKENKREMPMKEYFNRLKNLPFRTVKISSQDICYVSNIQPTPEGGKYLATVTIYQIFEGCYAEKNCYKDITKKEIDVTIELKVDDFGEKRWVIMLGNVRVTETRKL
jgi:hypothetical protein